MITHTAKGWRADYRAWGRRKRQTFATKEEATEAQREAQRQANNSHTINRLADLEPRNLRCAQRRKDGSRCRREGTDTHDENGKPTCEEHQAA